MTCSDINHNTTVTNLYKPIRVMFYWRRIKTDASMLTGIMSMIS